MIRVLILFVLVAFLCGMRPVGSTYLYGQAAVQAKGPAPAFVIKTNIKNDTHENCNLKMRHVASENGVYYPGGDIKKFIYFMVMHNKSEKEIDKVRKDLLLAFPNAEIRRTDSEKMSDVFFELAK